MIKFQGLNLFNARCMLAVGVCFSVSGILSAQDIESDYQLKPFEAVYTALRHGSDIGSAKMSLLKTEADAYQLTYQSDVSRFFFSDKRTEKTQYKSEKQQLIPLSYQYERTGTGPNKKLNITFDHPNNTLTINKSKQLDIDNRIDNQLFRIDISKHLANGDQAFSYDFINYRGEPRSYQISVLTDEMLSLPIGAYNTIKVKVNRTSKKRITYAWFAPELNYTLVRLQQFKEDKEQGDIQLKSFALLD